MLERIIAHVSGSVKPDCLIVAEAATDDDPYAGIPCNEKGVPRWSWCPSCYAEAEARDDALLQLAMPPLPAEAVCDEGLDFTDEEIDHIALYNATVDELMRCLSSP